MDIQRLRNLTTGRLHTDISHVYQDLEMLTGTKGLMTYMIPRVNKAVRPWLKDNVKEPRFWDDKYDTKHTGNIDLPVPTKEERAEFLEAYKAMPDPLSGKEVITVQI